MSLVDDPRFAKDTHAYQLTKSTNILKSLPLIGLPVPYDDELKYLSLLPNGISHSLDRYLGGFCVCAKRRGGGMTTNHANVVNVRACSSL